MIVATPLGLGRTLGVSVRVETRTGPVWAFPVEDKTIGAHLIVTTDGPFVAVRVGERVEAVFPDDLQAVNPKNLEPLARIWAAVFGR